MSSTPGTESLKFTLSAAGVRRRRQPLLGPVTRRPDDLGDLRLRGGNVLVEGDVTSWKSKPSSRVIFSGGSPPAVPGAAGAGVTFEVRRPRIRRRIRCWNREGPTDLPPDQTGGRPRPAAAGSSGVAAGRAGATALSAPGAQHCCEQAADRDRPEPIRVGVCGGRRRDRGSGRSGSADEGILCTGGGSVGRAGRDCGAGEAVDGLFPASGRVRRSGLGAGERLFARKTHLSGWSAHRMSRRRRRVTRSRISLGFLFPVRHVYRRLPNG